MKNGLKMNPDYIEVYDNALSSEQCKEIIEYTNEQKLTPSKYGVDGGKPVKDTLMVEGVHFFDDSIVSQHLNLALSIYTPKYRESHPFIDVLTRWELVPAYTIKKYEPGMAYHAPHCEIDGWRHVHRMLVWMVYFNTVTDGGNTYFPQYDRTIDAVEGRLVIWPASWTHIHHGIVSNTQTKYISSGWWGFWDLLKDGNIPYKYL